MTWTPLSPEAVRDLLAGLDVPWWLAGGWALDAYAGRPTREHADTDVSVLRRDQAAVRAYLAGWDLRVADPPGTLRPWTSDVATAHDVWCRPAPGEPWALQIMLEESDGDDWVYRRDPRVRRPVASLGGDHVLAPEVQLLYKSKDPRPQDVADRALVLPLLGAEARAWLAASGG